MQADSLPVSCLHDVKKTHTYTVHSDLLLDISTLIYKFGELVTSTPRYP